MIWFGLILSVFNSVFIWNFYDFRVGTWNAACDWLTLALSRFKASAIQWPVWPTYMAYHLVNNLSIRQIQSQVQLFSHWFPVLISDQSDGYIFDKSESLSSLPSFFWCNLILIFAMARKRVLIFLYQFDLDWFSISNFFRLTDWLRNQPVENQTDCY